MPLDGNLPKPDLKTFSAILRDKSCWPKGFKWDYNDCMTCGLGLAMELYSSFLPFGDSFPNTYNVRRLFDISPAKAEEIFLHLAGRLPLHMDDTTRGVQVRKLMEARSKITPEHVADAIDQYLVTIERNDHKMKELVACH